MSKKTFADWKADCDKFDINSFNNVLSCYKALGSLTTGYFTVKGARDITQNNEMTVILDNIRKQIKEKDWKK